MFKKNPLTNAHPEYKALKDPKIILLVAGSVLGLANHAHSKLLITDAEYHYIIMGGNEKKEFVLALLHIVGIQIQKDPRFLESFITEVLDEIGPPASSLGEKLRKSFLLYSFNFLVLTTIY